MNNLLRLQHWQVFIYLIIIPPFFPSGDSEKYFQLVWGTLFILWIIKIDQELYNRLPHGVGLNFKFLFTSLVISTAYFMTWLTVDRFHITDENYLTYGWNVWIYVMLHLYCLFTFFYAIRFTAKAIASIENNKDVGMAHYTTYMAGLFFFPIGIWWIQPKINKILRTTVQAGESIH